MQQRQQLKKYSELLNDPLWKRKRGLIIARDHYKCTSCNSTDNLNVHHLYYVIGNYKPWNYPNNALVTLCQKCHERWHDTHDIEYREKNWRKNRKYKSPKNYKVSVVVKKKKVKKVVVVLTPKQRYIKKFRERKSKFIEQDNEDRLLILKESGLSNYMEIFKKTKNFTTKELNNYVKYKLHNGQ
jgi:5-methylcytosine-specific restriction endonuclease McrA